MNNKMKIVFPSLSENERLARTVCAAFVIGLDPTIEEMSEIKTAVSEAVTNAIIHGYDKQSGNIEIEAEIEGDVVTYVIKDSGCGIENIEMARRPLYTGKPESERSGMGFAIMEAFTDSMEVESKVGVGTVIRLQKRIVKDDR